MRTLEGLLSSMAMTVDLQAAGTTESLATDSTYIPFLRLRCGKLCGGGSGRDIMVVVRLGMVMRWGVSADDCRRK